MGAGADEQQTMARLAKSFGGGYPNNGQLCDMENQAEGLAQAEKITFDDALKQISTDLG